MVKRYNAKDCTVTVAGRNITGFGEDMISIEKEEALAENSVGAQGDVVRSEINNDIYTITMTVQPTSPHLAFLMNLKNRTKAFPVWVQNKSLGIKAGGSEAFITEMPEISLGAEDEDVEIAFTVYDGNVTFA